MNMRPDEFKARKKLRLDQKHLELWVRFPNSESEKYGHTKLNQLHYCEPDTGKVVRVSDGCVMCFERDSLMFLKNTIWVFIGELK